MFTTLTQNIPAEQVLRAAYYHTPSELLCDAELVNNKENEVVSAPAAICSSCDLLVSASMPFTLQSKESMRVSGDDEIRRDSVYERLYGRRLKSEARRRSIAIKAAEDEYKDCTFHPLLYTKPRRKSCESPWGTKATQAKKDYLEGNICMPCLQETIRKSVLEGRDLVHLNDIEYSNLQQHSKSSKVPTVLPLWSERVTPTKQGTLNNSMKLLHRSSAPPNYSSSRYRDDCYIAIRGLKKLPSPTFSANRLKCEEKKRILTPIRNCTCSDGQLNVGMPGDSVCKKVASLQKRSKNDQTKQQHSLEKTEVEVTDEKAVEYNRDQMIMERKRSSLDSKSDDTLKLWNEIQKEWVLLSTEKSDIPRPRTIGSTTVEATMQHGATNTSSQHSLKSRPEYTSANVVETYQRAVKTALYLEERDRSKLAKVSTSKSKFPLDMSASLKLEEVDLCADLEKNDLEHSYQLHTRKNVLRAKRARSSSEPCGRTGKSYRASEILFEFKSAIIEAESLTKKNRLFRAPESTLKIPRPVSTASSSPQAIKKAAQYVESSSQTLETSFASVCLNPQFDFVAGALVADQRDLVAASSSIFVNSPAPTRQKSESDSRMQGLSHAFDKLSSRFSRSALSSAAHVCSEKEEPARLNLNEPKHLNAECDTTSYNLVAFAVTLSLAFLSSVLERPFSQR